VVVAAGKMQLPGKTVDRVAVAEKLVLMLPQELVFLDKETTVASEMLLETTVAAAVAEQADQEVYAIQKLQVMAAQALLMLYQDHYNIMVVVVAQV
jgi:hypothetical protein